MKIDIMHPAEQITTIMSRIYRYQMTTTSGGNLSILDEAGDIWISPGGYDKGSITEEDIVQIKPDGTVIGIHAPSSELPFHKALIQKRPGTRAVLHAHPPALVAFSIARKLPNVKMLPEAALICGELAMADYDVPGSRALGDKILETFLENKNIKAVILENHGVVIASDSLFEAFRIFEALEYCARLELKAKDLHRQPVSLTENQIRLVNNIMPALGEFTHTPESYEKKLRKQMVAMIQRSYHQRLFNGTTGTISCRVSGDTFVITPYGADRKYLQPEDMVAIKGDKKEAGKTPSRSVGLHQKIYELHPEINAVLMSQPYSIMAFAVTGADFDSRTIPESYIMLRDIPRISVTRLYEEPDSIARALSESAQVVMVENNCIVTCGESLLKAFDRLEVADFSAQSIIEAQKLGGVVKINDAQVEEINEVFGLK